MAVGRRSRNLVTARRRVADDGEDEEHDVGSVDLDSQSDASALTGANDSLDRGSEWSAMPDKRPVPSAHKERWPPAGDVHGFRSDGLHLNAGPEAQRSPFAMSADTQAMVDGLEIPPGNHDEDIIQFDDDDIEEYVPPPKPINAIETPRATTRPDQGHSLDQPPPTGIPAHSQHQPPAKGHATRHSQALNNKNSARWSHDLHETVKEPSQTVRLPAKSPVADPPKPPSLSTTAVLGLMTMRVMLPGMKEPIVYEKMPVKHHVRLPDLRPPLRRDKPVRIAIQDKPPRYIFPSVERSFIFIPRAQRPNQQGNRYRNRGAYMSQFSSRRGSVYGGSNHGASGGLSRRSSVAREGLISPTDSLGSRPALGAPAGPARPVVRLPASTRPASNGPAQIPNGMALYGASLLPPYPLPSRPALRENRDVSIPMYQPRPQKAVSLDTLETPTAPDRFQAPQQQEQQPFHHQVPANTNAQQGSEGQPRLASPQHQRTSMTPSALLPEQAVNAQPFQPGHSVYYPSSYPMQPPFYYFPTPPDGQALPYAASQMGPMGLYSHQGPYMIPALGPAPPGPVGANADAAGPYAQESNGTVYFFNPPPNGEAAEGSHSGTYSLPAGANLMKADAPEFYFQPPPMMYYPTQ